MVLFVHKIKTNTILCLSHKCSMKGLMETSLLINFLREKALSLSNFPFCSQSVADGMVYVDALSFSLNYPLERGGKSEIITF